MVKGRQKQVVVMRMNGNRFYEEAYFVLRDGRAADEACESTMMAEANRILDECMLAPRPPRRRRLSRRRAFVMGVGVGAALALGVACLL